ncbi:HesA/MoeB/ThiF family protein [Streptomyces drozdowiczii]|uniref:ThiF family adenylyltransferase n=1 Tax=Streptomyces drozdowiczii TaxID=202862 RepID=A0ABY6PK56_9ACTN|nr:ThiF family adenylyltransferase [Streptomyces drozdowiczii]MCX0241881.1 ThiF family adenylyltransferase [Streptomyces drozdowiczii]UZK52712.1 ThiF family adenylyltransferase [Streptomyces drozdowiczii]
MRVALKECSWQTVGEDLVVVFDPRESITLADPEGKVEALLSVLHESPRSTPGLRTALAARGVTVTDEELESGLAGLAGLGLVECEQGRFTGDPAVDERHFSNLAFFGTFSDLDRHRTEFLSRVRDAHVLVLGVGGGGSSLVQCLAGLGAGRLTLLDHDRVETRNFARQFLYRHEDVGRSKVERAAAWVRAYDPDIEVRTVDRWVAGPEDLTDLTDGVDLMVGGLDGHPDAGLWVNEAAVRAGVPLVVGGATRTLLSYMSVDPGMSACLACEFSQRPEEGTGAAAAEDLVHGMRTTNPLIGPVAMQIGSLIALEGLRYLTGFQQPLAAGARIRLDLREGMAGSRIPFNKDPDCPVCALAPVRVPAA